ncbi:iron ABC transporter permease [Clostridium sp. Marseille-P2415]|uniref:FecCD family ABC transporter permease n=1 Tax=Clostridium sp. Marseille-P2415 TaxID=1805471 RepID=UPI0009889533
MTEMNVQANPAEPAGKEGNGSREIWKKHAGMSFLAVILLFLITFYISVNTGSIELSVSQLLRGLFVEYDAQVATVWDLRFPRILIASLGGAALSVSGVLFQACMKNPIADPGIIGVSSGAGFVSVLIAGMFPELYFLTPFLAFAGGILACVMVYLLAFQNGLNPLRVVLVGVAVNAVFTGLTQAFNSMTGGNLSGVASIANANIAQKTWDDVFIITGYAVLGLVLAWLVFYQCDLLSLSDRTARGLGVNVTAVRIGVSLIAVVLASISTAEVGVVSFIGLIVPHIARILIGSGHKALIPFSMIGGAFLMLLADTLGRTIAAPYEISASILLSIVGGPMLIILLRRSEKTYGV